MQEVIHEINLYPIVLGVLSALLVIFLSNVLRRRVEGQDDMRRRERYLQALFAWLITEAVEEAVFYQKISRAEADRYYQMIGSRCHLYNLLPKGPDPSFPDEEELKTAIRKRIRGKLPVRKILGKPRKILSPR